MNTSKKTSLLFLSAISLLGMMPVLEAKEQARPPAVSQSNPNVIVIMVDDQGYGDVKAHGHPFIRTPNMDKLHSESVRFTIFYAIRKIL